MQKIAILSVILSALLSGCCGLQAFHEGILAVAKTTPKTSTSCVTGAYGVSCVSYTEPRDDIDVILLEED